MKDWLVWLLIVAVIAVLLYGLVVIATEYRC
jgi:hypothetical protein